MKDEVKQKGFFFFKMEKITAYVHAYGNDPVERKMYTIKERGKELEW